MRWACLYVRLALQGENMLDILLPTYDVEDTVTDPVIKLYIVGWSKALHQCTIQCGGCSATQCWWEGSSTCCSKPSRTPSCEGITWLTSRGIWSMLQGTLTAPIHSPEGEPIPVSSNSTCESEGITRTGGRSCSELSSTMTWRRLYNTVWRAKIVWYLTT